MVKLGFHSRWVSWIMECVSTVSYSIMVNGTLHQCSLPSRGIQHDNLLFPYLFILCVEALSGLLLNANNLGYISSFPMGRRSLKVNHLFFTDDILIFCRDNSIEWSQMLSLIVTYEQASGQLLNKEKSSIVFSSNSPLQVKETITTIIRTCAHDSLKKYLGLPTCLGWKKSKYFHFLLDKKFLSKMSHWKNKFLYGVGKEILLKVVLQAISTYTMSIFLLSKSISFRLNGLYKKF